MRVRNGSGCKELFPEPDLKWIGGELMCLAVPMRVSRIVDEETAVVSQGETKLEISTALLQDVRLGDYVIVHAGFAIDILDLQEAEERLELFRRMKDAAP